MGKSIEATYQKKTQKEHILLRPDAYIGSVEKLTQFQWVLDKDGTFQYRNVTFVPGLYKIFDEILVNAADNKARDPTMRYIKVTIDPVSGKIAVYNDGRGIPIEIHKEEKVYVPELIFGHLLTSSNYDDSDKKTTGGRNGYGAKLCNIFSKRFVVETGNKRTKQKYRQIFTDNMSVTHPPVITSEATDDFTKIIFRPDLAKFGMTEFDDDIMALFRRRVWDLAGCVRNIQVVLDGELIPVRNFLDYCNRLLPKGDLAPVVAHEKLNDRWEVVVTTNPVGQFQQMSFVNSICTYKGGTHVSAITDQVTAHVLAKVTSAQKKSKSVSVKAFQIKNHLQVFVNCLIENPTFDSQTKENMTLRATAFGSKPVLSASFMKKLEKTNLMERILAFAQIKEDKLMKQTDGGKRQRLTGMMKLDDANMAGTKLAHKCTLILTEGDSAKALAVAGIGSVGRDFFGVFPLRGKLLNVRDASSEQIAGNSEISSIKKIMGLQHGKVYNTVEGLRYGHLMMMTDQDHDGSHIKGLIINFLDHFFPSLLKVDGFLQEFITPIVKATHGHHGQKVFFTLPEYHAWREDVRPSNRWVVKYYKGLGTSTSAEAKEYFSNLTDHRKDFDVCTDKGRQLLDMAFNKKMADQRKKSLDEIKQNTFIDHNVEKITIPDFVNRELILFWKYDNVRSIPSVADGLKPGQRKILFGCFKRKLHSEIKVAQLGGYIAEHSAYHHGEESLHQTIMGMAANFTGSNNINLLEPRGQFGTRLQGGKDRASPRYVFTQLSKITRAIFHPDDDALLTYLEDDGTRIEPVWYLPVLPMILVNGAEGIGTGWATNIPQFNPKDIVRNIRRLMRGDEMATMTPWCRGFKGTIEQTSPGKYRTVGKYELLNRNTVKITELPVGMWTQAYKATLEKELEKPSAFLREYKEFHTEKTVHFELTLTDAAAKDTSDETMDKRLHLQTTICTTNMVAFDPDGKIVRYETANDIIREFFALRLKMYKDRKDHLLRKLRAEHERLANKMRFITEVTQSTLVIYNRKRADVVAELTERNYKPMSGDDGSEKTNFSYLLNLPLWNLTTEYIEGLQKECEKKQVELKSLEETSPSTLWETDLLAVMVQYKADALELAAAEEPQPTKKRGRDVTEPSGGKRKTMRHQAL